MYNKIQNKQCKYNFLITIDKLIKQHIFYRNDFVLSFLIFINSFHYMNLNTAEGHALDFFFHFVFVFIA